MNNLPLVNVFKYPYELWDTRDQTIDEMRQSSNFHERVKVKLNARIQNHNEAAEHILLKVVDNQLEHFIKDYLNSSVSFNNMRKGMPSRTPKSLSDFQRKFQSNDFKQVTIDINNIGKKLSEGQYLFHGGLWPRGAGKSFITKRPLSTSFCPQIALRNAEWAGKSYYAGEINIFVLRVVNPQTNVFCFRINGTDKGHEVEVLFASGAQLTLRRKTLIKTDGSVYIACRERTLKKEIPFYLLEVDIS